MQPPPSKENTFRPNRSIIKVAMNVAAKFTTPINIELTLLSMFEPEPLKISTA